jgi:hypothetical protein
MGGGLLQLVAYGAQDAYLSGNPQITFWKGLFKRHTNFAMEPFRINLTGQPNWGVKHSALIGRHADLLYSTYIEVVMPEGQFVNNDGYRLGYNLIKYVELDIGGQLIDRLYGEWLFLWDCLSSDVQTGTKLLDMVAGGRNSETFTTPTLSNCANGRDSAGFTLYIPLNFFYTRNPGAALPLIALQYHEVKINIEWNDAKFIAGNFNNAKTLKQPIQAAVYIDYIYLDTEERRRMAQNSHEYLIEQVQFNEEKGITSVNNRIDLTFNHPVKELVWVVQPEYYTNCNLTAALPPPPEPQPRLVRLQPFTYDVEVIKEQWLQINGQDRLDRRPGTYYNKVQPYQHHTGSFNLVRGGTADFERQRQPGAYMYSFALRPEEHQPSGTCNFSRIDTATLVLSVNGQWFNPNSLNEDPVEDISIGEDDGWNVRVYAVNYNILRVMSGMGGLAYSN